jgi:integrase
MASPRTETGAPATKVVGGTLGAAISTLLIWGLTQAGLTVDESVKVALTTVITFAAGYMIPPAPRDSVKNVPARAVRRRETVTVRSRRPRKYLTESEVEKLIEATKMNRWGHGDGVDRAERLGHVPRRGVADG